MYMHLFPLFNIGKGVVPITFDPSRRSFYIIDLTRYRAKSYRILITIALSRRKDPRQAPARHRNRIPVVAGAWCASAPTEAAKHPWSDLRFAI